MAAELASVTTIGFPKMVGETAKAFDFVAGGSELALTVHWLGTKQKFIARLADDDQSYWSGNLTPRDPVILKNILADPANPDLLFCATPIEGIETRDFTPLFIHEDYVFFFAVGRGL